VAVRFGTRPARGRQRQILEEHHAPVKRFETANARTGRALRIDARVGLWPTGGRGVAMAWDG